MKHTPTPWKLHNPDHEWPRIQDGNGVNILKTDCSMSGGEWVEDIEISNANAAHTIHCVNLHDELVVFVERVKDGFRGSSIGSDAAALLSRARGEKAGE